MFSIVVRMMMAPYITMYVGTFEQLGLATQQFARRRSMLGAVFSARNGKIFVVYYRGAGIVFKQP